MKRFFAILLIMMLVLALFGCSAEETAPQVTVPEATVATQVEETAPATEAETIPLPTEPVYDLSTWQGNYDLGMAHLEKDEWQEAIASFDAAIALDPHLADAYAQRGNAYIFSGETEENLALAWEDYQQSLQIDETNAYAHLGIVDIHIRRGEYDLADAAMASGLEKTNHDPLLVAINHVLETGSYFDSSNQCRMHRQKFYGDNDTLLGVIIKKFENGVAVSAESFDSNGNSTGFVELYETTNGNVTERVSISVGITDTNIVISKRLVVDTIHEDGTRVHEDIGFDRNGNRSSFGRTYYDAEGYLIRHESYGKDGNLQFYSLNEYDSEGRVIRSSNYYPDGTLKEYTLHFYDSEGNQTKSEFYRGNGELQQYTVEVYLEGNNVGFETYSADGELIYSSINE